MPYIYLASPYSAPDKFLRISRYRAALRACNELMMAGELVFCPVAYGHSLEEKARQNFPYDYWLRWSKALLAPAKALYVLTLPGWNLSEGVRTEVRLAHELEIPILGYTNLVEAESVSGLDIMNEFGLVMRRRPPVPFIIKDDQRD